MDALELGRNLRSLREAAKLTQKQLAAQAEVSQQALAFWEQGKREPGVFAAKRLAAALGVTLDHLLEDRMEEWTAGEIPPKRGRGRPKKEVKPAARPRRKPQKTK